MPLPPSTLRRLAAGFDPRLKGGVSRRVLQRLALAILGNRLTSWGPVHATTPRLASWLESVPQEELHRLFAVATREILNGRVQSIQEVRAEIRASRRVFLSPCACRAGTKVADLRAPAGEIALTGAPEDCLPWLDRLLDVPAKTRSPLLGILEQARARRGQPALSRLDHFFRENGDHVELLLDHPRYAAQWREGILRNGEAWEVDPDVALAWVDLQWFTRGLVFTSMVLVDAPYTICSCPGPERDGGCLLFNFYHYSGLEETLTLDPSARCGPCARYSARRDRPCYGCGCDHDHPDQDAPLGLVDPRPLYRP